MCSPFLPPRTNQSYVSQERVKTLHRPSSFLCDRVIFFFSTFHFSYYNSKAFFQNALNPFYVNFEILADYYTRALTIYSYVSWWQTTNLNYLQQSTFMAFTSKSGVYITTPNTYYNLRVCGREGNCLFWSFHKIFHETNVWFSVFKLLFLFARSNWKFRTVWSCDPNFRRNIFQLAHFK